MPTITQAISFYCEVELVYQYTEKWVGEGLLTVIGGFGVPSLASC